MEAGVNTQLGFIAWTRNPGRLMDIGRVFDVQPKIIYLPRIKSKWLAPVRYVLSAVITVHWLLRTRPRVVVVSCPPPFAGALVAAYAHMYGAAFILDAHPGSFSHRGQIWKFFVPLQRLLVRRALVTMVTEPCLAAIAREWGGDPLVFHEAPPSFQVSRPNGGMKDRPKVVFTTIFDPDEPLDVITTAACELAECDVIITGDDARLARRHRHRLLAESHVQFTGWLEQPQYLKLIDSADVVVALTCDPYSVMRSAYEAIYLGKATVLSDTPTLRSYFSPSVFVENSPAAVVSGVRNVVVDYELWIDQMRARYQILIERWTNQQAALESAISRANGYSREYGK